MAPSQKRRKLLAHTRPRTLAKPNTTTLSSRTTRAIIRSHHNLHKQLSKAQAANDTNLTESLTSQLDAAGGLTAYQQASVHGQSAVRGGDSSHVLLDWVREILGKREPVSSGPSEAQSATDEPGSTPNPHIRKIRLLEVGALRTDNAYARSGLFDMVRIDLRSQHPDILQQDFMQRPVPSNADALASEGFDIISLSLVLNYVSDAADRGAMLERAAQFLWPRGKDSEKLQAMIPGLFVVLPAPCVCNSRYLDERRLLGIMQALGYELVKKKYTSKLAYFYWRLSGPRQVQKFPKKQVAPGAARNNFAIVLK